MYIKSKKAALKHTLKPLLVLFFTVMFITFVGIPLVYAFLWSSVNPDYPWGYDSVLPQNPNFYNWEYVFKYSGLLVAIKNSFIIAPLTVILTLILALPTAYALGRKKLKGKEFFKIIVLLPMALPGMAISLFLGRTLYDMHLSGTYVGVILGHTFVTMAYMLRCLITAFEAVPQDLLDAAANLGAGSWNKLKNVYLPMILPGLIAGSMFSFIHSVEEFNMSFIIGAPEITTITTVLFSFMGDNFMRTRASVVSLILLIPNMLVLFITERRIKTEYMGAALGKM